MGHNRAGTNRKKRLKRRRKNEQALAALWPMKDVHVYFCDHWGCMRMSIRKDKQWIDFGEAKSQAEINKKRKHPERFCTTRVWRGTPLEKSQPSVNMDKIQKTRRLPNGVVEIERVDLDDTTEVRSNPPEDAGGCQPRKRSATGT